MSNEHAMRFPFVGSAMLLSLFLLFKFLSKDLVNTVLTLYFFVLGIVALSYVLFYDPLFSFFLTVLFKEIFMTPLFSLFVQGNITTIYQTIFAKALEWWSHSLALSIFSLYVTCLPLYLSALLPWMNNDVSLNCGIRSYMIPHIWLSMMTVCGLYFCWVLQVWNCLYEVPTRYVIFFFG